MKKKLKNIATLVFAVIGFIALALLPGFVVMTVGVISDKLLKDEDENELP